MEEINKKYEEISQGIFPFVGTNRVTILKRGYYKKKRSKYRGITKILDKKTNKEKVILMGYYYVDDDYIVIPDNLDLTVNKTSLLKAVIHKNAILTKKLLV